MRILSDDVLAIYVMSTSISALIPSPGPSYDLRTGIPPRTMPVLLGTPVREF